MLAFDRQGEWRVADAHGSGPYPRTRGFILLAHTLSSPHPGRSGWSANTSKFAFCSGVFSPQRAYAGRPLLPSGSQRANPSRSSAVHGHPGGRGPAAAARRARPPSAGSSACRRCGRDASASQPRQHPARSRRRGFRPRGAGRRRRPAVEGMSGSVRPSSAAATRTGSPRCRLTSPAAGPSRRRRRRPAPADSSAGRRSPDAPSGPGRDQPVISAATQLQRDGLTASTAGTSTGAGRSCSRPGPVTGAVPRGGAGSRPVQLDAQCVEAATLVGGSSRRWRSSRCSSRPVR